MTRAAAAAARHLRHAAMLLHRYVGLVLALFLTITGLTGATIAWNDELESVFAPSLFVLPPARGASPALDPFALRDAAVRAVPEFAINSVDFTRPADAPARFFVEARPGGRDPVETEIALDPASGRLIGQRRQGDLREGVVNLMPFIYDLHDELALGERGALILGIVALLWTIDCFVGAYLTFPVRSTNGRGAGAWLMRWRRAWNVRLPTKPFKLTFDLHSAAGLWLWGMLLVLAWSSVGFNLPGIYRPVTCLFLQCAMPHDVPPAKNPAASPRLDWRAAHKVAVRQMARIAAREAFVIRSERLMFYDPTSHRYTYRVKSSRDPGKLGNTQLLLDGDTGRIAVVDIPTGRAAGDTFTTWTEDLHTADVFGRFMQVVLTIVGLSVALLSITGVLIYSRKRNARGRHALWRRRTSATERNSNTLV